MKRECMACGSTEKLMYAYGNLQAVGIKNLAVGLLLCKPCREEMFKQPEKFREKFDNYSSSSKRRKR